MSSSDGPMTEGVRPRRGGRPPLNRTPEERREMRNAADRKRRSEKRATQIADGTYRPPTNSQNNAVRDHALGVADLPPEITEKIDKRTLYLAYLEKGLKRSQAAEKAGVTYSAVKYWRKTDDAFRLKEIDVEEMFLDNVEDVVRQLAQANDLKAALTLLERRRPEVWAPKQRVEVEHKLQFAGSLEERMSRINRLMDASKQPELEAVIWDAEVVEDEALPEQLLGSEES